MRRLLLPTLVLIAFASAPAAAQSPVVLSDEFNDGVFAPFWIATALSCGSPIESGGQLVMNKTASCAGGLQVASDPGASRIRGDFDAVVDFDLPSFNLSGALRVASFAFRTVDDVHTAVIERYNRQTGDGAPNAFNYKGWIDVSLNSSPAVAWAATTHTTGKFRVVRTGGTVTMSYWSGMAWVTLKTGAFPTDDVYLLLTTSSGTFVNGAWTARWDNLSVTASETVPAQAVYLADDFENGVLDTPLHPFTGCGTVTESAGKLRLANNTLCAGGVSARASKSELRLCGDFDLSVDLRKVVMGTPSTGGWFYTGISLGDTTFVLNGNRAAIEWHNRYANGDCMFTSAVKSWVGNPANCVSSVRATNATAVRFRVQRVGSRLRMYQSQGVAWVLERVSNFTTQPVLFELFAGSGTSGNAIVIDFDNLEARGHAEDEGAPVLVIPPDGSYACPSDVPPFSPADASASGAPENGALTITAEESVTGGAGSASDPSFLQRTFTVRDQCAHSISATQTITVADGEAPALTPPAAITIAPGPGISGCATTIALAGLGSPAVSDNCGSPTVVVSGRPPDDLYPEGVTTLTWTATDAVGNVTTAEQTVSIACPRGRVAGTVLRECNGTTVPVEGLAVELLHAGDVLATTATASTGEYAFEEVRLATYTVRVGVVPGYAVDIDTRLIALETGAENTTLALEPFTYTCLLADVAGAVTATCHAASTPAAGATIDLYRENELAQQILVATTSTDVAGAYRFDDIALGTYEVAIVAPLGYVATPAAQDVVLATPDGLVAALGIELVCQPIAAQPRSMAYWKHQVNVYLTGKGHAQESLADLLSYIDLIVERFNENPLNPIALYDAGAAGTEDRLRELQRLLTVNRGGNKNLRARQHLLGLLLNVVSLRISQGEVISADGATVSQAITHCYTMVADDLGSNDQTAQAIAEAINAGEQVAAGLIPLTTANITYRNPLGVIAPAAGSLVFAFDGVRPNPSRGAITLAFTLDQDEAARAEVFDVVGRRVAEHMWRELGAGRHAVALPGQAELGAGVYTVRLTHGERALSARFIRMR